MNKKYISKYICLNSLFLKNENKKNFEDFIKKQFEKRYYE